MPMKPRKKSVRGLVSGREQNLQSQTKEKLQTMREWYFTLSPSCPYWGDPFEFWHAGWYRQL